MNCCNHNPNDPNGNDHGNQHAHKGGHLSHILMMALCCGAPLLILLVLPLLGSSLPGLRAVLVSIAPFLCPVMMIGMIPMMLRHGDKRGDNRQEEERPNQSEALDAPKRDRFS